MPTSYRPCEPDQVMLLSAAQQQWLPAGHLAHFIDDTIDALDLKVFCARYDGGRSRKIERRLQEALPRDRAGQAGHGGH